MIYPTSLTALRRVGGADAAPLQKDDPRLEAAQALCYEHFQPVLAEVFHEPRKSLKTKNQSTVRHSMLEAIRDERGADYRITDEVIDYFHALYWEFAEAIERLRLMTVEKLLGTDPETYIRNAVREKKAEYLKCDAPGSKLAVYPNRSANSKRKKKGKKPYPPLYKQEAPDPDDFESFGLPSHDTDVELLDTIAAAIRLTSSDDDDIVIDDESLKVLESNLGDNGRRVVKALHAGANIGEAGKLLSREKRKALNL